MPVAVEIQPRKGYMLHYPMIYKHVLAPLIKAFNVRFVFADRWNSIATLDKAAEDYAHLQLQGLQYSVKYNDFAITRSYLEDGKLLLPKIEMDFDKLRHVDSYPSYFNFKPAAHLLFQFGSVKDKGTTVVKGDGFTDDLFRALVLGVGRIVSDKIMPEILRLSFLKTQTNVGAVTSGRFYGYHGPHAMPNKPISSVRAGHSAGATQSTSTSGVNRPSSVVRVSR